MKNLYLITRSDDPDYDEFVGLVVAASSEDTAKQLAFGAETKHRYGENCLSCSSPSFNAKNISLKLIGTTDQFEKDQIVIADFLHG